MLYSNITWHSNVKYAVYRGGTGSWIAMADRLGSASGTDKTKRVISDRHIELLARCDRRLPSKRLAFFKRQDQYAFPAIFLCRPLQQGGQTGVTRRFAALPVIEAMPRRTFRGPSIQLHFHSVITSLLFLIKSPRWFSLASSIEKTRLAEKNWTLLELEKSKKRRCGSEPVALIVLMDAQQRGETHVDEESDTFYFSCVSSTDKAVSKITHYSVYSALLSKHTVLICSAVRTSRGD